MTTEELLAEERRAHAETRADLEQMRAGLLMMSHVCIDCGIQDPMVFMVRDDLWLRVARSDDWLCMFCFELRLATVDCRLMAADLTDAPCNREHGLLRECCEDEMAEAAEQHARAENAVQDLREVEAERLERDALLRDIDAAVRAVDDEAGLVVERGYSPRTLLRKTIPALAAMVSARVKAIGRDDRPAPAADTPVTARDPIARALPADYRPPTRDVIEAIDAFMHPNGRCICWGEGRCDWCVRTAESEKET